MEITKGGSAPSKKKRKNSFHFKNYNGLSGAAWVAAGTECGVPVDRMDDWTDIQVARRVDAKVEYTSLFSLQVVTQSTAYRSIASKFNTWQ